MIFLYGDNTHIDIKSIFIAETTLDDPAYWKTDINQLLA